MSAAERARQAGLVAQALCLAADAEALLLAAAAALADVGAARGERGDEQTSAARDLVGLAAGLARMGHGLRGAEHRHSLAAERGAL